VVAAVDENRVKALTAKLSAGFVDGVLDSLEEPSRRARLEAIVNGIASKAAGSATDAVLRAGPRRRGRGAHAPGHERDAARPAEGGRLRGADEGLRGRGARDRQQATLGFQDALDDTRRDRASRQDAEGGRSDRNRSEQRVQTGGRILWTLESAWAHSRWASPNALLGHRKPAARSEVQQRDNALILLTDALKSTAAQPGSQELRDVLKASMRDRAGAEHIRKVSARRVDKCWASTAKSRPDGVNGGGAADATISRCGRWDVPRRSLENCGEGPQAWAKGCGNRPLGE